jgi:multiple antibiotic resistance protein
MREFTNYCLLGLSALFPLINPPGTALELLSVVGIVEAKPYKILARKIAINTILFLIVVATAGPYALEFFGVSVEILQVVGGAVLAAMGWALLNKPDVEKDTKDRNLTASAEDSAARLWQSRTFYPLTFPFTVGPGSVAVMLTLSTQAKNAAIAARVPAFVGLFVSIAVLSFLVYLCCAYAPLVAEHFPSTLVHGVLRIIAFLVICIGVQIAWRGTHSLLFPSGH